MKVVKHRVIESINKCTSELDHLGEKERLLIDKCVSQILEVTEELHACSYDNLNTIYKSLNDVQETLANQRFDSEKEEANEDKQVVTKGGFGNMMTKWIKGNMWVWALICFFGLAAWGGSLAPIYSKLDVSNKALVEQGEQNDKIIEKLDDFSEKLVDSEKAVIRIDGNMDKLNSEIKTLKRRQSSEFKHLDSLYNNTIKNHAGSEE